MKIDHIGQAVDTPTSLETVAMTIDEASVQHIMGTLTSLYSDPALAVLREYSSNAIDSHIRAGVEVPIQISTPSSGIGSYLVVEDFGIGLSKDDIANVYSRYGLSTKGTSNDEIGGFGLGCKSALAITDRFDIVGVKDGVETVAYIAKNVKGVGVVHFVSETATDKPNGVKVTIPVEARHQSRFNKNNLFSFFVGYKSNSVMVNGEVIPTMFDKPWTQITAGGEIIGAIYESRVDYGSPQSGYHTVAANIGGVTYNLNSFTSHNETLNKFFSKARSYKVVLNLPIGSADLTPSREALMNTERTNASLTATIVDAEQAITDAIISRITEQKDIKSATKTYIVEKRRWSFDTPVSYRGVAITDYVSFKDAGVSVTMMSRDKRTKTKASQVRTLNEVALAYLTGYADDVTPIFVKSNGQNDSLAKNLVYYSQKKYNTELLSAYIFDDSVKGISPLFDALTADFVTAEEVIEIATDFRSANRKLALAASKELRGSGASKVSGSLPAIDMTVGDLLVTPFSMDKIQTAKKVAYIHASLSNSRLGRVFPTIGWHYNNGGVKVYDYNGVMTTVRQALPDYTIVFLSANRKVEKFLEAVPNAVEVGAAVEKFSVIEINEKANLIAHKLIANHHRSHGSEYRQLAELTSALKSEGAFKMISNESDKNFLESLTTGFDRNDTDVQLFENWGRGNQKVENDIANITATLEAFSQKYALISQLRVYTNEQAVHIVSYMNSVA